MLRPEHPEVLARDWQPPVLIGRSEAVDRVGRMLAPTCPGQRATHAACVVGPPGSGTSAVAHRAGLAVAEMIRGEEGGPVPRLVTVRVRWCTGAQAVAAELLRRFDPGFEPQGFAVAEIMAGFLRRLHREGRPAVVILDDIGPDSPDLRLVTRALVAPARFLPEGVDSPMRLWLILAGASEATATWRRARRAGVPSDHTLVLPPLRPSEIEAIVRDRARRALGREPPEPWAGEVVDAVASTSATRAIERLRRELCETAIIPPSSIPSVAAEARPLAIEPRLLVALEASARDRPVSLREVRERERRLAFLEGERPLPTTTFWRRIVRLEALGLVRREVRPGGRGGTLSRVELVRPVSEWLPVSSGSPRAVVAVGPGWLAPMGAATAPLGLPAASLGSGPSGVRPA
jgi:hypothetical protein